MVNTTSPNLLKAFDGFEDATPDTIALETVLIYDGVFLLAQSLLNIPMEPEPVNVRERRADEKGNRTNWVPSFRRILRIFALSLYVSLLGPQ
jgi:hypothetical protein